MDMKIEVNHLPEKFELKEGAKEFPLLIAIYFSYICNSRCPHCPFTNSDIRDKYKETPFMEEQVFKKIADECGQYNSFIRISGGGEPLLHPKAIELMTYAKQVNAKIGLITNGSLLSTDKVDALLDINTDVIEISVDAADKETHAKVRTGLDFDVVMSNILYLVKKRNQLNSDTKILVSVVNQNIIANQLDDIKTFWENIVDNVIVRKYLTWNVNDPANSGDSTPYLKDRVPCPFPFERLNIDTRGNVLFCGYDISGKSDFGNIKQTSIKEIWQGPKFNSWRESILKGEYEKIELCNECPDWRYRSWNYNYWHVLKQAK